MRSMTRWVAASSSILALMAAAWRPASGSIPGRTGGGDTETPAFVLEEASFSQPYYRRGDEVVLGLLVNAQAASVSADFAAVDSKFRASAVQMKTDGDGRWVVRYRLSQGNTRRAGTFPVPVSVMVPGRGAVTVPLTPDYLPLGPGVLSLPEGHFRPEPLPRREVHRALSVIADVQQDDQAAQQRGRTIRLTFRIGSDQSLPASALKLELVEARADGHWQVPVQLANEQCTRGRCEYEAHALVSVDPEGPGRGGLPAGMGQLVTPAGQAAPFRLPPLGKTALPSEDTHRVSGTISFQFRNRFPDPAFSPLSPMYPWKAPRVEITQVKPVAMHSCASRTSAGTTSRA